MLAIHLVVGALTALLAAALSLAQGSSILVTLSAFGTGAALAILASGLIAAARTPIN